MDHPEAQSIPLGPFEVVHQRPDEVAFEWNSVLNGASRCSEVCCEIIDSLGVVAATVWPDIVVQRYAVLGDPQGELGPFAVDACQHRVQRIGPNRDVPGRRWRRRGQLAGAAHDVRWPANMIRIGDDAVLLVEVDPKEIHGLADCLVILIPDEIEVGDTAPEIPRVIWIASAE